MQKITTMIMSSQQVKATTSSMLEMAITSYMQDAVKMKFAQAMATT